MCWVEVAMRFIKVIKTMAAKAYGALTTVC